MLLSVHIKFFNRLYIHFFKPDMKSTYKNGFSLVELLIVMLLVVIVSTAALTLFKTTSRYEASQQETVEHTQNLRTALYTIARDIRMAGNGMTLFGSPLVQIYVDPKLFDDKTQDSEGWFKYLGANEYGVRAIYGTDSGTNIGQSDTLSIFYTEVENTFPIGRLKSEYRPSSGVTGNLITLSAPVEFGEGKTLVDGDMIAIVNGPLTIILEANVGVGPDSTTVINIGDRFKPKAAMPNNGSFPPGSAVYNIKDVVFVTYSVDSDKNILIANYHDKIGSFKTFNPDGSTVVNEAVLSVANNIEDLQVGYFLSTNDGSKPVMTPGPPNFANNKRVVAAKVALVSRATSKSETTKGEAGDPKTIMDHQSSTEEGYSRRVMAETVSLRNL